MSAESSGIACAARSGMVNSFFMDSFHVRPAQFADKAGWSRLRQALWPHGAGAEHEQDIDRQLQSDGVTFVAEDMGGKLIGFAEVSLRRDYVEKAAASPVPFLEGWYVEAPFRQQGVGRALVQAVEEWAVARGFTELASDAELANELSIDLHLRLGFSETERTVSFLKKLV
jgi:aminoglycoside 6'-N-acetyltransferase I